MQLPRLLARRVRVLNPAAVHVSGLRLLAIAIVATVLLLTSPAQAETTAGPKADLAGGGALWLEDGRSLPGLHLSAAFAPWRYVGFLAESTFYEERTTFAGGLRLLRDIRAVTAFGQLTIGTAPLDDVALQFGGGVDVPLGKWFAVRVAGGLKVSGDDGSTYVGLRLSTGLVARLGY